MNRIVCSAFAVFALSGIASAQGEAQKAFDRLKTLTGTWTGTEGGQKVKVAYKVTGGGSALIETQFPDTPYEMVTLYHMDGERLIMTHYCAARNQPTLKLNAVKDPSTLDFDFISGTNMKPSDLHMHSVSIKFLGKDHVLSTWTSYMKGKAAGTVHFDLRRSKPAAPRSSK